VDGLFAGGSGGGVTEAANPSAAHTDAAASFDPLRSRLIRLGYRMLGSLADAEDIVQEAFIRWMATDRAKVQQPEAFLRRTVTRLCLDHLKSARIRRESYFGEWLPEPVEEEPEDADVTLPLMLALERLSPLERAAFLLHDVFGQDFDEIATTLKRDAAACRQLAARARTHVREAKPRFAVDKQRGLELANAFFAASRSGDMSALGAMLADDVSVHSDGGGKRNATPDVIRGQDHVLKLHRGLAVLYRKYGSTLVRTVFINGLPGFVTMEADGEYQTTAFDIEDGAIKAIYVMRNPDKLKHWH
jgi:RNA polymerase sigma-70 factor (ECF subfamily)